MANSDIRGRRYGKNNIPKVCPNCFRPYFQVGKYKSDSICECKVQQKVKKNNYLMLYNLRIKGHKKNIFIVKRKKV